MILTYDQLPAFAGVVGMVDGAFDPLHAGHIGYRVESADCSVKGNPQISRPFFICLLGIGGNRRDEKDNNQEQCVILNFHVFEELKVNNLSRGEEKA